MIGVKSWGEDRYGALPMSDSYEENEEFDVIIVSNDCKDLWAIAVGIEQAEKEAFLVSDHGFAYEVRRRKTDEIIDVNLHKFSGYTVQLKGVKGE